jgi:hypothetical protein
MQLAIAQALQDLDHRTPSFIRDEAIRGSDAEETRDIVIDVLRYEGDPKAARLVKDLLACRGRVRVIRREV